MRGFLQVEVDVMVIGREHEMAVHERVVGLERSFALAVAVGRVSAVGVYPFHSHSLHSRRVGCCWVEVVRGFEIEIDEIEVVIAEQWNQGMSC